MDTLLVSYWTYSLIMHCTQAWYNWTYSLIMHCTQAWYNLHNCQQPSVSALIRGMIKVASWKKSSRWATSLNMTDQSMRSAQRTCDRKLYLGHDQDQRAPSIQMTPVTARWAQNISLTDRLSSSMLRICYYRAVTTPPWVGKTQENVGPNLEWNPWCRAF